MDKFPSDRYLRATVVLAIDILVSTLASVCVLVMCDMMVAGPSLSRALMLIYMPGALAASAASFLITRIYRVIIRYATLREATKLCIAIALKEVLLGAVMAAFTLHHGLALPIIGAMVTIDFVTTVCALLLLYVSMYAVYTLVAHHHRTTPSQQRVIVYGTGDKSVSLVTRLLQSPHYKVVGFLSYGPHERESRLMDLPVYHFEDEDDVTRLRRKLNLHGLLFAYRADALAEQNRLMEHCSHAGMKLFIAPGIDEMTDGKMPGAGIRKIRIEDLLGRDEIQISMELIRQNVQGKTVLVTGAAGSIGSELCRQLARLDVAKLIMLDNAETPLHNVRLEFEERYPELKFVPVIGDVRIEQRLDFVFRKWRPQVVFHAAAYKHVPLMEENPCEAVMVNVCGSRNVANMCLRYGAEKMVMVSTDKAVNPTNIMGCTKRLAEIYVQALGLAVDSGAVPGHTTFVTTRFGNVLGSNGSVIPRFTEQIEKGGPVTVTDPEIRRFFMTIPEACRLVMEAATMASATRIFVFDMGTPIKIADLARKMIQLAGYEPGRDIAIEYTGLRPGEKLYEEVLATKENTIPTDHKRIYVAKVRAYDLAEATAVTDELERLSREVEIEQMVKLMKRTVPEFKSKHSKFEIYDLPDATIHTDA